jgi:alpha-beta hydrolase superfamily lysophospholipase
MDKIFFQTSDNLKISALWWDQHAGKSILLLHMMPAIKESWVPLADRLAAKGLNALAIDFRGHGESEGGDYKSFTAKQYQAYQEDMTAAVDFLRQKYPKGEIFLGGASIGANHTIKYMALHPEILKGFALSAGLDYHGVKALDDIAKFSKNQEILLAASFDDGRKDGDNCGIMAQKLAKACSGRQKTILYETGGHGTNMFGAHPELYDEISSFLIK